MDHLQAGNVSPTISIAKMVDFGGWEMPVQYSGVVDEHHAVRRAVGLFDVSHMGEIEVPRKGSRAAGGLCHHQRGVLGVS